jgi:hypothetical protein
MRYEGEALSIYASCGEFAVPARAWQRMLALAQIYGWQSQGTAPPDELAIDAEMWKGDPSDWDGRYFPSYGQQVTEVDAKDLAAALERALPDIPDHDARGNKAERKDDDTGWLATADSRVNALEAFSGPSKEIFRSFIAHCREEGGLWLY